MTIVFHLQKLEEISQRDFSEYNCFLAVFLSRGDNGKILMRKRELNIQGHILDHFRGNNCKSLIGKPKLFFFQVRKLCLSESSTEITYCTMQKSETKM